MVVTGRFELPTSRLGITYSIIYSFIKSFVFIHLYNISLTLGLSEHPETKSNLYNVELP